MAELLGRALHPLARQHAPTLATLPPLGAARHLAARRHAGPADTHIAPVAALAVEAQAFVDQTVAVVVQPVAPLRRRPPARPAGVAQAAAAVHLVHLAIAVVVQPVAGLDRGWPIMVVHAHRRAVTADQHAHRAPPEPTGVADRLLAADVVHGAVAVVVQAVADLDGHGPTLVAGVAQPLVDLLVAVLVDVVADLEPAVGLPALVWVAGVAQAVAVGVLLPGVGPVRAAVAGVPYPVVVGVGLQPVGRPRAVVLLSTEPVGVLVVAGAAEGLEQGQAAERGVGGGVPPIGSARPSDRPGAIGGLLLRELPGHVVVPTRRLLGEPVVRGIPNPADVLGEHAIVKLAVVDHHDQRLRGGP